MVQLSVGGIVLGKNPIVKSVQTVTGTMGSNINITPVNPNHSALSLNGMSYGDNNIGGDDLYLWCDFSLLNGSVVATSAPSSRAGTFSCEVVEYYPGVIKSIQTGAISSDTTITPVEPNKSALTCLSNHTKLNEATLFKDGDYYYGPRMDLLNGSVINFTSAVAGASNYQVVEFF